MTEEIESRLRIFGVPCILWEIKKTSLESGISKEFHLFRHSWKLQFEKISRVNKMGVIEEDAVVKLTLIKSSVNYPVFRFSLLCGWLNKNKDCDFAKKSSKLFSDFIGNESVQIWLEHYDSFIQTRECDKLYFHCRFSDITDRSTEQIHELIPSIAPLCVNTLVENLENLFKTSTMTDVVLKCGDKNFTAHRSILSCRSPVFRAMFENNFKESHQGVVDITDIESEVLQQLLAYVYTGNVDTTNESVESICNVFKAADKYCIEPLKDRCELFIKDNLEPHQACNVLMMSDLYGHLTLKSYVVSYIVQRKEFLLSEEWETFAKKHLALANEVLVHYVRISKLK